MLAARPAAARAYLRVSSAEQGRAGTSLDGQRGELLAYAAARGWPAPTIYLEIESGSAERLERRVELHRLLAEAQPGEVVLVTRVDRWSRDLVYGIQSIRALVARGVDWIAVGDGLDAASPPGAERLGLILWVAEAERLRIRERTVGRRKALRDAGCWVEGPPPFGYARRADRRLEPRPDDAAIVAEAFARSAGGASVSEVAAFLRAAAPTRYWDKKSVHRLLKNRVYLGEHRSSRGPWIPETHAAIIAPDLWARVEAGFARRAHAGGRLPAESRTASWLLRGLASCARCGARMGARYGPGGRDYYACARRARGENCDSAGLRVEPVDAAAGALVLARLQELRAQLATAPPRPTAAIVGPKRAELAARRERLVDLAERGAITAEDLTRRLATITAELATVDARAAEEATERSRTDPAARAGVLGHVDAIAAAWASMPVAERREVVRELASRIVLAAGESPLVTWRPLEELVAG